MNTSSGAHPNVEVREVRGIRFVQSSQTPTAWVCQRCGGAVADYIKHAQWHDALRDALLGAGSPWGPGQPLERV